MSPCFVRCAILNSSPPPGARPLQAGPAGWLSTCFRAPAMWKRQRILEKLYFSLLAIICSHRIQPQEALLVSANNLVLCFSAEKCFYFELYYIMVLAAGMWWHSGQQWGGDGDGDGEVIMVTIW